jgi:hypothetical protein
MSTAVELEDCIALIIDGEEEPCIKFGNNINSIGRKKE